MKEERKDRRGAGVPQQRDKKKAENTDENSPERYSAEKICAGLLRPERLFSLDRTILAAVFDKAVYPWDILGRLKDFILSAGKKLPESDYISLGDGIWAAKDAKISRTADISAPCIIDAGAEVRHCAFIRGSAVIGKNAVVGNSCEIKNSLLFDSAKVPHFNYVGDSLLGFEAHMGAGAVTSNVKSDKSEVAVKMKYGFGGYFEYGEVYFETGRKKVGAFIGDRAEIGCNSVLCPGSVIGRGATVYPLSLVRGYLPENAIFKSRDDIVLRSAEN